MKDALQVTPRTLPPLPPRQRSAAHADGARLAPLPDGNAALEPPGVCTEQLREDVLDCRRRVRDALDTVIERVVELRGHDVKSLCRRELSGLIGDLSLADLMQMVAMGRRSAVIDVRDGAVAGRIWCSEGEMIDAESGSLRGAHAAYRLLALDQGALCADFRPLSRRRVIHDGVEALVMEAARRKDECAELQRRLGGLQGSWWACPTAPSERRDEAEAAVLEAFDRGARLDRVLADNAVGDLETLRALTQLIQQGALRPRPHAPAPVAVVPAQLARLRRWLAPAVSWLEGHPRTFAAALSVGSSLLVVAAMARVDTEAESEAAAVKTVVAAAEPAAYPLRVSVRPEAATLWLDGSRVGTGQLALDLRRDGRTHELRVLAPGCRSETVLFQDRSPPRVIVLEPASDGSSRPGRCGR
jgi:uncharacterized protein DUF4388